MIIVEAELVYEGVVDANLINLMLLRLIVILRRNIYCYDCIDFPICLGHKQVIWCKILLGLLEEI